MTYKFKVVKETASILLTNEGEYVDSFFFNKYDFDNGNVTMENINFEAGKLAALNEVDEYVFDTSDFV